MIKNVIFDIGNVLTDFRWKDFLRDKGFDDIMIERIGKASIESKLWREFDRGGWTEEELIRAFVAQDPAIEAQIVQAFSDIRGIVRIREYAIPWIQSLKESGYGVYYLSNFSEKAARECADSIAFIPYTDGGILSYMEKMVKPDPAIYRLLPERFALNPGECVFIDDTPVNVEAAKEQGYQGIVFQTKEQVERELEELGVR